MNGGFGLEKLCCYMSSLTVSLLLVVFCGMFSIRASVWLVLGLEGMEFIYRLG
jgi:hypothetical protein